MSDPFDLLEALGKTNNAYLATGEDQAADELLERIVRADSSSPVGVVQLARRRKRRIAVAVGTVTLLGAGTAAAIGWWTAKPTTTAQISCYSDASRTPAIQVGLPAEPGRTPTEQCLPAWTNGPISADGAPQLAECVSENGLVAVVPGTPEICATLGLALNDVTRPDGSTTPGAAITLQDELSNAFVGVCATVDDARATIQQVLDREHLTNWTIALGTPLDNSRRCAAPALDEQQHVVVIVGVPAG